MNHKPDDNGNRLVSGARSAYGQLYEHLAQEIRDGVYAEGERLPSERDLCQLFQVSRTTVRQAVRRLAQAGLVQTRRGSGTVVCAAPPGEKRDLFGLVVPDLGWAVYCDIVDAVSNIAIDNDMGVLLGVHNEEVDRFTRIIQTFCRSKTAANIIILPRILEGDHLDRLINCGTPYVLLMRDHPKLTCNKVVLDNVEIGAEATRLLVSYGCRQILYIAPLDYLTAWHRLSGYRQALAQCGIEYKTENVIDISVVAEEHRLDYAEKAVANLLAQQKAFDGVVAFNDVTATRVINSLQRCGKHVPGDVAVVGADDRWYAATCAVPLTTLHFDGAAAARLAVQAAMRLQSGILDGAVTYIPVQVVYRKSCPAATGTAIVGL